MINFDELKKYIRNIEYELEYGEEQNAERVAVNVKCLRSVIDFANEAIARQSVTSEEVAGAIELLREPSKGMDYYWLDAQMHDALNLAITALKAYQPWIPVGERSPDDDTRVLTLMNNGIYEVQRFNNGLWWDSYGEWEKNVTHWKPLPEPPKGE